jgi:hypothetical protein
MQKLIHCRLTDRQLTRRCPSLPRKQSDGQAGPPERRQPRGRMDFGRADACMRKRMEVEWLE